MSIERKQSIYERMSHERIKVVCAQIDILGHYDPEGRERRVQELYNISHKSLIVEPSEKSIEEMDELVRKYQRELTDYRKRNPNVEERDEIKEKFGELEKLSGSCSF